MIECRGIYTLIGSKPVTSLRLIPIIDENHKREIYDKKSKEFQKHIPFEKFQPSKEDCKTQWKEWVKIQEKYLGNQFLLIEDEDWGEVFFINLPSAQYVLTKYYDDFSKHTNLAFSPEEAVYLIGRSSEPFWKKIKKNHFLLGLLLGFGEKNAQLFDWEKKGIAHFSLRRTTSIATHSGKDLQDLNINDLDLPIFITYQPIDEQEERYKIERDRCKQIYSNQDFVELTIGFLKGTQPEREKPSEETLKRMKEWSMNNARLKD